jgi:single-stranded-DNA-specific exonuclease
MLNKMFTKQWIEPAEDRTPGDLQAFVGGHALVAKILYERGHTTVSAARAFLDPAAFQPTPPLDWPGMQGAAQRVEQAIQTGQRICVWGDFDVDGQTSTALLVSTLSELGASVTYHIPVRERESHGVNLGVLKELHARQKLGLVLTCDTGIAAHEAIDYANSVGLDFVVSDHHELPAQLPAAHAIINPRLLPPNHPAGALPGVGAAYKLAQELYRRAGMPEAVEGHLDLVALGIVADVALQTGETRYLLQRGLAALRDPRRAGLLALLEMAELEPSGITEEHIGFVIAPRLNALGRLSDANPIVEFFTTQDMSRARVLANHLEGLNARRKLLTDQVFQAAQAQLEQDPALLDGSALVLAHPTWPAGVIGIVASRLVERYNRPTILISAPSGEAARGSARSVEGCNITRAIAAQAHILLGYGGHAMAAGLSLEAERIPEFRRALQTTLAQTLGDQPLQPALQIDGVLPLADLSPELVADFERLAPFGAGNPALTFSSPDMRLRSYSSIGRGDEHLQLIVEDEAGQMHKVIWWQGAGWELPEAALEGQPVDLAYHVRMANYRGARQLQVEFVDLRVRPLPEGIQTQELRPVQVIDLRGQSHPLQRLQQIIKDEDCLVWAEAEALASLVQAGIPARDRYRLIPAPCLAIWTIPPTRLELEAALEAVSPQRVVLFGLHPNTDQPGEFLQRLAGLVKYALQEKEGQVGLTALAAGTAQDERAVRKGLAWLEASGHICIAEKQGDELLLSPGQGVPTIERGKMEEQLRAMLAETSAFRAYFARAEAEGLIQAGGASLPTKK